MPILRGDRGDNQQDGQVTSMVAEASPPGPLVVVVVAPRFDQTSGSGKQFFISPRSWHGLAWPGTAANSPFGRADMSRTQPCWSQARIITSSPSGLDWWAKCRPKKTGTRQDSQFLQRDKTPMKESPSLLPQGTETLPWGSPGWPSTEQAGP